ARALELHDRLPREDILVLPEGDREAQPGNIQRILLRNPLDPPRATAVEIPHPVEGVTKSVRIERERRQEELHALGSSQDLVNDDRVAMAFPTKTPTPRGEMKKREEVTVRMDTGHVAGGGRGSGLLRPDRRQLPRLSR